MGSPNFLVTLAILGFIPVTVMCFQWLGPRRGALAAIFGGWLFLPTFLSGGPIPLLNTKGMYVPAVVLLVSLLTDAPSWSMFRLHKADIPMLVVCFSPFVSAMTNGLGAYEGASAVLESTMMWGAPYVLGRVYVRDRSALEELGLALVISALVYLPLCLWEIRMSPQLHLKLYGYTTWDFIQAMRSGGFRPAVFMQHGLMAALFMGSATLVAYWLWRTKSRKGIGSLSMGWISLALGVLMLLFKSSGALVLLIGGMAVLEGTRRLRSHLLILLLVAAPPAYCVARIAGWSGETLIELSRDLINAERADSLAYRIRMEDMLIGKALQKPAFGWGRWGRALIYGEDGKPLSVTDGHWIIILGNAGYVGLLANGVAMFLPVLLLLRRFPVRHWGSGPLAPAVVLAVMVLLSNADNLFNAMLMPLFPGAAGALTTFSLLVRPSRGRQVAAQQPRTNLVRGDPPLDVGAGS